MDSIGNNLYCYCNNNSICYSDSSGCFPLWGIVLGGIAAIGVDHYISKNYPDGYADYSRDLGYGFSEKTFYAQGSGFNVDKNGVTICDLETGGAEFTYQNNEGQTVNLNLATVFATVEFDWSGIPALDFSGVASMASVDFEHKIPIFQYDVIVTSELHALAIGGGFEMDIESAKIKVTPPGIGIVSSYGVDIDRR